MIGGRNAGGGGNGQWAVMRIVARRRDPADWVRDLVETVQRVERAMGRVARLVGCCDHIAYGIVGEGRRLACRADVLEHPSECIEGIRVLARHTV